ncbi:hypothetical protein RXV90_22435 [Rhodophyticola sp. MJ-SS7]|nr:hypothetical protein [Rhodophyticola sp. MJ-SS7]
MSVSFLPSNVGSRVAILSWALQQKSQSILFFTKHAIPSVTALVHHILKSKGCIICADYVDGDPEYLASDRIDVHIASSYSSQRKLNLLIESRKGSGSPLSQDVYVLYHAADIRLHLSVIQPKYDKLKVCYFGALENCKFADDLQGKVTLIDGSNSVKFENGWAKLESFNAHYCIRPKNDNGSYSAKPFTKGIVAAACRSVALVSIDTDDAVELLGSDYPYFLSDASAEDVISGVISLEGDFGSLDWRLALDATMDAGRVASGASLARSLSGLVEDLSE